MVLINGKKIEALESKEFWKSVRRLPVWYQIFCILLVGTLFVLDEKNTILATVVQTLHFSFGTTLLWPKAYQEMLLETSLKDRLAFTAYATLLVGVIVGACRFANWFQLWCLKERVPVSLGNGVNGGENAGLLTLDAKGRPIQNPQHPHTQGLSPDPSRPFQHGSSSGGLQPSTKSAEGGARHPVQTELRRLQLSDDEFSAMVQVIPANTFSVASSLSSSSAGGSNLMDEKHQPSPTRQQTTRGGQEQAAASSRAGDQSHTTAMQPMVTALNIVIGLLSLVEAAVVVGERIPMYLSHVNEDFDADTEEDVLVALEKHGHISTQWMVLSTLFQTMLWRFILPLGLALWYRLYHDLKSGHIVSFRWCLVTFLGFRAGVFFTAVFFEVIDPEVRLGSRWPLSLWIVLFRHLSLLALTNHVFGASNRRGNLVVPSPSAHHSLKSKTMVIGSALVGHFFRLAIYECTAVLTVLAAMVGVHVIELLSLWLVVFLIAVWIPAAIDSCSTDFFAVLGVFISGILAMTPGAAEVTSSQVCLMAIRLSLLVFLGFSNVSLLFRSFRWTLGSRLRAVLAVALPLLILVLTASISGIHPGETFISLLENERSSAVGEGEEFGPTAASLEGLNAEETLFGGAIVEVKGAAKRCLSWSIDLLVGDAEAVMQHYSKFASQAAATLKKVAGNLTVSDASRSGKEGAQYTPGDTTFVSYLLADPNVTFQNRLITLMAFILAHFLGLLPSMRSLRRQPSRGAAAKSSTHREGTSGGVSAAGENHLNTRPGAAAGRHRRVSVVGEQNIPIALGEVGSRGRRRTSVISPLTWATSIDEESSKHTAVSNKFGKDFTPVFLIRSLHSLVVVLMLFFSLLVGFSLVFVTFSRGGPSASGEQAAVRGSSYSLHSQGTGTTILGFVISGICAGLLMDSKPKIFLHVLRMVGLRDGGGARTGHSNFDFDSDSNDEEEE